MNSRTVFLWTGLVVALLVVGGVGTVLFYKLNQGESSTASATIEEIIAGEFPSAQDKQGTGGVPVTVRGLFVIYVHNESDGDWHVAVTDGKVPVFITEIIPADQAAEGRPLAGTTIDETGTPFCDSFHQNDNWHGYTCWEIHPVTDWKLSSQTVTMTTTPGNLQGLNVSVSYSSNPIAPGSYQNITVGVFDSEGVVANQTVFIHVDYASGSTTQDFTCETYNDGTCSVSWMIGNDATPGTFGVTVDVNGIDFESTFGVA